MNRRDLIKAAVVVPIVGIAKPKSAIGDKANHLVLKSPDWGKLVVNKGLTEYTESIVAILQEFTKSPVKTERSTWGVGHDAVPCTVFYLGHLGCHFSISDKEFENKISVDKRSLVGIPKTRWINAIECVNDGINDGIDYIQRFDPEYDPRNYR